MSWLMRKFTAPTRYRELPAVDHTGADLESVCPDHGVEIGDVHFFVGPESRLL